MFGSEPLEFSQGESESAGFSDTETVESDLPQGFVEAAKTDRLAIGGLMYLRLSANWRENQVIKNEPFGNPNLMDVYLDARPNDRVRAYARGRLRYNPGGAANTALLAQNAQTASVNLDQLWIKFDIARRVYLTAGKQRVRFGTGRFWNPTDVLQGTRDPIAVFDERLGLSAIKMHVPLETVGMNLYGLATLDDVTSLDTLGSAVRVEKIVGTGEIAATFAKRAQQPYVLGVDASFGLGPLDFRLEGVVRHKDAGPYWQGNLDFAPDTLAVLQAFQSAGISDPADISTQQAIAILQGAGFLPQPRNRSADWIPQVVAGVEYGIRIGDTKVLYLGGEYFYNDAGYDNADLYPWMIFAGGFRPLYLGRHYAALYGTIPGLGSGAQHTIIASVLGNLSDTSYLSRLDWRYTLHQYIRLDANIMYMAGGGELQYGVTIPVSPVANSLTGTAVSGIHIPAPRWSFGLGIQVDL